MMKKKNNVVFMNIIVMILALLIILPMMTLLIWIFTERWAWPDLVPQIFSDRALREVLRRKTELIRVFASSITISTIVALLSVIIGIMTARALVFYEFFWKKLVAFLTILPFMVPGTVFAMGVQLVFIKLGLNNTLTGVILAHLICSLPYAVRLLLDGTKAVGNRLEEQARVLGASPLTAFLRTSLPMLVPVILSAVSMSYIVSFSQYFLTLMIGGGNVKTFTIIMVPYLQSSNRNIACIYSVIFLGITLAVFGIFDWIAKYFTKNRGDEYFSI